MSDKYSKSNIYDNWERLVAAVSKKQQLWELFHQQSRSPSIRSEASDFTPSSSSRYSIYGVVVDNLSTGNSSRWEEAFAKLHSKLVMVSDFNPAFNIEDVYLGSAELLGRGTFGNVYTVVMENGVTIVVRRLKSRMTSEFEFKKSMEVLSKVKHENVVGLRAYYCSEDERLMLYDNYSQGSVHSLLHEPNSENRFHVDWEIRLRFAIGAAWGIDEIHTQNDGKLIHGNIKSSNVFLNSEHFGCISDLGLANMVSSPFLPTALCYAPEVENTQDISQASDVYSFGILILELLTRKSSSYVPGGPHAVDLVKLVTSVKSKLWAARVFDTYLLKDPRIKDKMVKMLHVGISCVAKKVKKRPKMAAVVKMLEDIFVNVTGSLAPVSRKLVFVGDNNPYFELEEMLGSSAELIGKGTFGSSYKFKLENGDTFRAKRIVDSIGSLEESQQHMVFIGRMRHENVGALKAYYNTKDEKLLVHDYHSQSNVSTLLHEERPVGCEPLDWEARLKIAIGAARGIAYIHQQAARTFVHGNIKTENIFLNEQKFGVIVDAGLAKLRRPSKPYALLTTGHWAPEVIDSSRVSQASDVYSFGVVLLELVSGKSSKGIKNYDGFVSLVESLIYRRKMDQEVFDVELVKDVKCDKDAMEQLLLIGLDCVATIPEQRPIMTQVVKMLDEIAGIHTEEIYTEEVYCEQTLVEMRLEYLLEDLLPTLVI